MGQLGSGLQNVGSAFGNANTFAPDPSGFSGSDWTARLLGGGMKGLGQGMQNQQGQQQRPQGVPVQFAPQQQPQVNPQIYDPTQRGGMPGPKGNMMAFYGQ